MFIDNFRKMRDSGISPIKVEITRYTGIALSYAYRYRLVVTVHASTLLP